MVSKMFTVAWFRHSRRGPTTNGEDIMNFIFQAVAGVLFKVLGPINGYKTVIGVGLGLVLEITRYFGIMPVAIDGNYMDFIWMTLAALGLGNKMEK